MLRLYAARGLRVCDVHGDAEFDCLRDRLAPIALDIVPADSHVGEIERSNRTVQERLRSCVHGLPFKRIPRLMIRHMVHDAIRCLNNFPWKYGVSYTLSPACIVTGAPPPDYNALTIRLLRPSFRTQRTLEHATRPLPRRDRTLPDRQRARRLLFPIARHRRANFPTPMDRNTDRGVRDRYFGPLVSGNSRAGGER